MQNPNEQHSEQKLMIVQWRESGKSISTFCKEKNISYHFFHYWRRKLSKPNSPAAASRFIKIKPPIIRDSIDSTCKIIFANGNRINFSTPPEVGYLKELLT